MSSEDRPRRNIELKATDPDPERSIEVCRALGASDAGIIRQRDTYFAARRGRLKLREEWPGVAHLIQYYRPDRPEQSASTSTRYAGSVASSS